MPKMRMNSRFLHFRPVIAVLALEHGAVGPRRTKAGGSKSGSSPAAPRPTGEELWVLASRSCMLAGDGTGNGLAWLRRAPGHDLGCANLHHLAPSCTDLARISHILHSMRHTNQVGHRANATVRRLRDHRLQPAQSGYRQIQ